MNDWVLALAVFDDGSGGGPALYAGGNFTSAGGVAANRIARWDGSNWSLLGSGMNNWVYSLTTFDDGSGFGPALYAGGSFTTAGGVTVNRIARWDGSNWSALGSGMTGSVLALTVFDDGSGSGPALYVGGSFTTAGGVTANRIARWDGSDWFALGSGMNNTVSALAVFEDGSGSGPALYAGGLFTLSPAGDAYLAKWQGCPSLSAPCPEDLTGDGTVDLSDLLAVLAAWGPCVGCAADVNGDDIVDLSDLLLILAAWGTCD